MNLLNFNKILHIIFIILFSYFIYKQYYLNNYNNYNNHNNNRRVKFRDELGGNLTEIIKFEKIDF
jgi:hypothetical protein